MSTLSLSVSSLTRGSRSSKPHRVWSALPLTGGGPPVLGNHLRMLHVLQLGPPPTKATLPAMAMEHIVEYGSSPSMSCPRSPPFRLMSTAQMYSEKAGL